MTFEIAQAEDAQGDFEFCGTHADWITCHDAEVVNSGPADCGKTVSGVMLMHMVASKYAGEQLAIVRKQYSDLVGSVCVTFQREVLDRFPYVEAYGGESPRWYDYSNGSRIWLGGLDKPGKTLGSERALVLVVQAGELRLSEWEMLIRIATGRGGSKYPWPRLLGDCNPWHPGHWIKRRETSGTLRLFNSSHRDNPELYNQQTGEITPGGIKRIGRLDNYTGSRNLRLRHGLWAAPEGAIYDIYDDEKHKDRARVIPHLWPRAVGVDPFGAFVAAVWVAWDEQSGILNVYREYCEPFGVTTTGHAQNMLKVTGGETIFAWLGGGPSERQARMDMNAAGVPLMEPPNVGVWAGIDRVYRLLKEFRLVIHDSCPKLLSEIGGYRRKMRDGQPTENIHDKDAYHMLDALRYVVSWLSAPAVEERVSYSPMRI